MRRRERRQESRGPWYLLTGLLIGLGLGLIYTWVINPVQYVDTSPDSLRPEAKDQYRSLIALAYQANGDIGRAFERLKLLKDERPAYELGDQAQRIISGSGSQEEARSLARLAADLAEMPPLAAATQIEEAQAEGGEVSTLPTATLDPNQMIRTATPEPTATSTPIATFTPRAQAVSQPVLTAPLVQKEQETVCTPGLPEGLLQVEVRDDEEEPIAGVRIDITWDGGQDFFFTGLYPEIHKGYADFIMDTNKTYSLRAGDAGEVISGIKVERCEGDNGSSYWGGVRLVFGY